MPYVGYLIWSRKSCGGDFLARIADGRIKLEFFDYGQYNQEFEIFRVSD